MICHSPAKINLSLKITGTREDGYHLLEMVNLPLELHDVIEIRKTGQFADTYVTCDDVALSQLHGDNLCHKAIDAMRAHFGFQENFIVNIHKEIPFAAGLGGGSSNAAAVMNAVNKILKLNATDEELASIGVGLGADVPFFLASRPMKVSGIGDVLEPIKVKKSYYCLLVKPERGLSTKEVYQVSDRFPKTRIDTDGVLKGLAQDDLNLICGASGNDLMAPAMSLLPDIGEIFARMKNMGFEVASMSGSGSTVFGLTSNKKLAKDAERFFENAGYIVRLTKTMAK